MALLERIRNMLLSPRTEWPVIAAEPASVRSIYTGYALQLAAIGPIVTAVSIPVLGVVAAILLYVVGLAGTLVLAVITDALAPYFGGEKDLVAAVKLVAYGYTAVWLSAALTRIPAVGRLIGLVALGYAIYTFYLGAPVLRKASQEKAVLFTAAVIGAAIVLGLVVSLVLMGTFLGGMMGMRSLMR